jgi:hypothetical protein
MPGLIQVKSARDGGHSFRLMHRLFFPLRLRRISSAAAMLLLMASAGAFPALAQQAAPNDPPYGAGTPMYQMNMGGGDAAPAARSAFIEDSKFNAQLKSFYFNRD